MNFWRRSQPFSNMSQCSSALGDWENFHNVVYSLTGSIINTTSVRFCFSTHFNRSSSAAKMAYKLSIGDNSPKAPVLRGCFTSDITCEIDVFTCDLKIQLNWTFWPCYF